MLRKILLLTSGLMIAGLFFTLWFFSGLNTQTAPDYSGDESLFGISSNASIVRGESGLPFISTSSENDFAFSLGYLQAQDRLWQMVWLRKEMKGETAALLGEKAVDWDVLIRMLGIETRAAELVKSLSEAEKQRLQAYTRGVNEYIRIHETRLPFEFALLDQKPEPWKPEHSAGIFLLYKWRNLIPEFKRKLLPYIMNQPDYRAFSSVLLPENSLSISEKFNPDSTRKNEIYKSPLWLLDENGWSFSISAFGENLTGTHDPLIMIEQLGPNDLPVSNYPVSGRVGEQLTGLLFGMPGTPWFLAGIQKDQAWIVSGFSDSLEVGTVAVPPQSLRVPLSIEVKDRLKIDLLVPMVASTTLFPGMITGLPGDSLQIYMRGINWNVSNDLNQLSGLPGKAGSNSKAGNFIFRSISTDKKSTALWADKIISKSDTLTVSQIKNKVKSVKTDSSLFNLIYNFRQNGHFQVTDFQNLSELLDGLEGLQIKSKILPVLTQDTSNSIRQNLVYLDSWQGELDHKSIGTSVFFTWKYMFLRNWLESDLGNDLFSLWVSDSRNSDKVLNSLLTGSDSIQSSLLPVTEDPVGLTINHAFKDAIGYLQDNLGVNSFNWRWENVNQITFHHKLEHLSGDFSLKIELSDGGKPSNPIFNAPLFSQFRQKQVQVSVLSVVANFHEPNLVQILCPTGISGNPNSPFYSNLSQPWSNQLWTIINTGPVQNEAVHTFILRPGK